MFLVCQSLPTCCVVVFVDGFHEDVSDSVSYWVCAQKRLHCQICEVSFALLSNSISFRFCCTSECDALLYGAACICRYDLDACDIQEKYPDLFQVHVNVEVEPQDRPSNKTPPWESFATKGLNPKILFSSREEQQEILTKFGEFSLYLAIFCPPLILQCFQVSLKSLKMV